MNDYNAATEQPESSILSSRAVQDQIDNVNFPPQSRPRVWFLTKGDSPIGTEVARRLLEHGNWVMAGVSTSGLARQGGTDWEELMMLAADGNGQPARKGKLRTCQFDFSSIAECQSAIAETTAAFGRLDVLLCCHSEALVGTIEELSQTPGTRSLVLSQLSANFFGPVNIIKCVLPTFRSQRSGHIIILTGITGHLGTPGLAAFCASQWAIEGYCDSLAYEIAPFGIRMSIVQSNIEVGLLTNKVTAVPEMEAYAPPENEAPLARGWLGGLTDRLASVTTRIDPAVAEDPLSRLTPSTFLHDEKEITSFHPLLPNSFRKELIAETVHAILAIGGHENPPARHIVGFEGVASVKEKLRTVSEELEEFLECSAAVEYQRRL